MVYYSESSLEVLVDMCPFLFLYADRPIASIAFHAQGEILAVASGHKVRFSCCCNLSNIDFYPSSGCVLMGSILSCSNY